MLGSNREFLIGVTDVLDINTFITTSGDRNSLGPLPWPPHITFDAPLFPSQWLWSMFHEHRPELPFRCSVEK
jgi:hypothetical protein